MNRKQIRLAFLVALATANAFAQAPAMGLGVGSPVTAAWKFVAIIGGLATAFFVCGLIFIGVKAVTSDHSQYSRLFDWAVWAIICGGATGLITAFVI
jgi:type IV secretory pathway VirB2 component (pilin)